MELRCSVAGFALGWMVVSVTRRSPCQVLEQESHVIDIVV